MITKTCSKCGETKPQTAEFFPKGQGGKGGFRCHCKVCTNATNRETQRRNSKRYEAGKRNGLLKRRYGITAEDYAAMLAAQGGKCAICKSADPKRRYQKYFSVDHDHETKQVRGLLCVRCNTLLGTLERGEGPKAVAMSALRYLENSELLHKLGATMRGLNPQERVIFEDLIWKAIRGDFHGVADCAMDLRELEAAHAK